MGRRDSRAVAIDHLTRRDFLGRGSALAGGAALGLGLTEALLAEVLGQGEPRSAAAVAGVLPSYLADVSGNGTLVKSDDKLVKAVLGARRGLDVLANAGYDHRADLFGRGRVDREDLNAVATARAFYRNNADLKRPRPVTVCWHYGWFNFNTRRPRKHHVWFKGGAYSSRDPQAEALFNDLKNEFGITVDALSWADPSRDGNLNNNLHLGYFNAPNRRTRRTALLYESLISLRAKPGERIDFDRNVTRRRLREHFAAMGKTFRDLDRAGGRPFLIDGKPVIFIYASHTWGLNVDGTGSQYDNIDRGMEDAIKAFSDATGKRPFVIGEEMTFVEADRFDASRRRRSANFDGVFLYHHAANADYIVRGGQALRGAYVEQVLEAVGNTYDGALEHVNRFTGKPMLVVPSLAAGFSKANVPTLFAGRADYADFLKRMIKLHEERFIVPRYGEARASTVTPIVSLGSWNEEWEGHAVMPSQFNRALSPRTQKGFDYVMAIKQAFGWNHYSSRGIHLGF